MGPFDKLKEKKELSLRSEQWDIEFNIKDVVRRESVGGELSPERRESIKQMAIENGANPKHIDTAIDQILKEIKEENDDFGRILKRFERALKYDNNTFRVYREIGMSIVESPIPTDKDRLIRLMFSVMKMANKKGPKFYMMIFPWNRGKDDYSHYWWLYYEKLYKRAQVLCPDAPQMSQLTNFYNDELNK